MAGDHSGLGGFLGVLGSFFEATNGQIQLNQQFCVGTDGWVAEWEHATLGRKGKTLESRNAFVYRFENDRIAEMWMLVGLPLVKLSHKLGAVHEHLVLGPSVS